MEASGGSYKLAGIFQQGKHQMAFMFLDSGLKCHLLLNSQTMVVPQDSIEETTTIHNGNVINSSGKPPIELPVEQVNTGWNHG